MNQNKLTFQSQNLIVDYLTFNIQGTPDFDLVNRIAKYLFQHFDFNSIISNCSKNKKYLFFSDKNRHQVEFAVYLRAPELNSFWDGTQIRFSGKNAMRFYQLIQQQKINWNLFKTQNFKLAKLNKFTLNRVDLCYSKTKKDIDTIQSFEFFLNSCHEKILQNSRTKHIKYSRNQKGFILKVGSRKSPNYYRVYENNHEIRFELEMKSSRVQSVQDFLFSHQIPEFEQILTKHFYNYSTKILVLDQVYTDWLIQYLRRKEKQDAGLLLPFFNQNSLSVSDTKKVFGLLQFLSFIQTIPFQTFETIMIQHQTYYAITFPLKDFAKFLGEEEKYKSYGDRYRRKKYIQFFTNLQHIKPLITAFSDQTFQSSVALPTLSIDKINFDWVVQLSIAKELYLYDYPFILTNSLIIYRNTYELQIRYKILQNFSVNDFKKTFDVQILLNSFNASQKRNANNKREIIRQLNQLPIQNQYELHLKNGKTKIVDKLTPLLIGKTQIMHFYETL